MQDVCSRLLYSLPAVGGYILASLYLLQNPVILHRRKRQAFHCRQISHRGGAGERIENTLGAFTHAVEVGTDMLELDCHLTEDGHVIVSHDNNLKRQTGCDVTISSLNLEDLPLYREKLEVRFYVGHYSTGQDRKFALLEEVFKKFSRMPVNIEVKENNRLLIKKISSLVKQYDREDITVWATSESDIMAQCREENPSMPYVFTMRRWLILLFLYYTGLLPFIPLGESVLQFYLLRVFNRLYIPDEPILRNKSVISLIEKVVMRKGLFEHLVKRGIPVQLFVCNEESDIEAAFALGATGIMTDYPTLLSDYCHKHPQPSLTHSE